jgi:hypothetical protein
VEADGEGVGHERPIGSREALRLHGALDPALELDRLDPGVKEPGRGTLEEPLEEALERRQAGHSRRA